MSFELCKLAIKHTTYAHLGNEADGWKGIIDHKNGCCQTWDAQYSTVLEIMIWMEGKLEQWNDG